MSKARKLIRKGEIFVNGIAKTCQDVVVAGDEIQVRPVGPVNHRKGGKKVTGKKVAVVYEDDHLAVIIKPAGVAVHGTGAYSLVDRYAEFLIATPLTDDALEKPVHAHRLVEPFLLCLLCLPA